MKCFLRLFVGRNLFFPYHIQEKQEILSYYTYPIVLSLQAENQFRESFIPFHQMAISGLECLIGKAQHTAQQADCPGKCHQAPT